MACLHVVSVWPACMWSLLASELIRIISLILSSFRIGASGNVSNGRNDGGCAFAGSGKPSSYRVMDQKHLEENLQTLVEGSGTADAEVILEAINYLDAAITGDRAGLDARLAHFLERRSYAKALDYIRDSSLNISGGCR